MNAENIRVAKWHPIFGKDLMVALEATLNINTDFNYDSNLLGEGMIHASPYQRKVYHPAFLADSDSNEKTVKFVPCFEGKIEYYRLGLWGRGISKKPFFVRFARFGEEKSFGFNDPGRPYIYLDFFSKKGDQFTPIFVKVLNRENGETVLLIVEGRFEVDRIELTIQKVSPAEVPPTLL